MKSIRACHVSHSVIQPVQNCRSGRGHLITAWFSSVVHFLLRVFPPLPLPAPFQHLTPPTDQLIKKQRFLVIKAAGYPDKISPSFFLSDSSAGCTRGERREGGIPPEMRMPNLRLFSDKLLPEVAARGVTAIVRREIKKKLRVKPPTSFPPCHWLGEVRWRQTTYESPAQPLPLLLWEIVNRIA